MRVARQRVVGELEPRRSDSQAATNGERSARVGQLLAESNPDMMSSSARLAELGAILAAGVRRLALSCQESLARIADFEAQCDAVKAHDQEPAEAAQ